LFSCRKPWNLSHASLATTHLILQVLAMAVVGNNWDSPAASPHFSFLVSRANRAHKSGGCATGNKQNPGTWAFDKACLDLLNGLPFPVSC